MTRRRGAGAPCEAEARRLWSMGEAGQSALWNRLAVTMGPARAREWLRSFEAALEGEATGRAPAQGNRPRRRSEWISQRFLV